MKPETLERLVIDRSLGELAPDAEELLGAYLDGNADAARSVEDIDDVIKTARRAANLGPPTAQELPLPVPRFVAEGFGGRRRSLLAAWVKPVAAAAVIGLAFWLGSLGARSDARSRGVLLPSINVTLVPRAAKEPSGGFWSLAELSRRSTTRRENQVPAINWLGPVSRPRLGEPS